MADYDTPGFQEAVVGPTGELAEIFQQDDARLETSNDHTQWLLATMQSSRFVRNAPVSIDLGMST